LRLTENSHSARAELKDKSGRTALMHAVEAGHSEFLRTVAERGQVKLQNSVGFFYFPSQLFYGSALDGPTGQPVLGDLTVVQYLEKHKQTEAVAALRKRIHSLIEICTKSIDDPKRTKPSPMALKLRAQFYRELGETEKADADAAQAKQIEDGS